MTLADICTLIQSHTEAADFPKQLIFYHPPPLPRQGNCPGRDTMAPLLPKQSPVLLSDSMAALVPRTA
jgi:hypothetical protein